MLAILARASLEGALLAAAVWMACRLLPRISPSVRALLWWCVAAKFVVALTWHTPIAIPLLPAPRELAGSTITASDAASRATPTIVSVPGTPRAKDDAVSLAAGLPAIPLTAILLGIWALGILVAAVQTLRAWQLTRGVVARATPADETVHAVVRDISRLLGVRRHTTVLISAEIESPLITGVLAPVILLPAERFAQLPAEQQRMALCHELAHRKRGDLWLGCVPALVERCFFFHPLARLAAREYAFWREAACDDAVLTSLGVSPQSYGRLLLALGVSRQPATFAAAGAAWSFSNLKRRVTMLSRTSSPSLAGRLVAASAVALAVVAVAPVRAVARTVDVPASAPAVAVPEPLFAASPELASFAQDRGEQERREQERREQERREQRAREARERERERERDRVAERQERAQERAERERELVREQRTREQRVRDDLREDVRARVRDDDRAKDDLNFVYFMNDDQTTMSGSRGDVSRARRYRRGNEKLLWFSRDGQDYIVRDPKLLREVDDLWGPVNRIGQEQGEIGARQGAIGAEQGKHGARLGEIGAKQGIVGARQGVVAAQLGLLAAREAQGLSASERRSMQGDRDRLDREMRALDREMQELGKQMRDVAPPRDLGDDMTALGRQMSVLGERMGVASRRANQGMRELTERAIRSGAAEVAR